MKNIFKGLLAVSAIAVIITLFTGSQTDPEQAVIKLGINLNGPADYSTEYAFIDAFHLSREWISQKKGAKWGEGPRVKRDANGWVTELAPDCWVESVMFTYGHQPKGEYLCLYEGEGKIEFFNPAKTLSSEPGMLVVNLDNNVAGAFFAIREINPQNPIKNIRFILPEMGERLLETPFTADFFDRWIGFDTYRFMDWMLTNNSKVKNWDERAKPTYCNYTEKGVPLEVMIDLCNRRKINPWFCMPHEATDDYIKQFALQVKKSLDPSLHVYIEYSNEVWNSMFQQNKWAEKKALELGLGPKDRPWEGAALYYGFRSTEIFKIWEEVFDNDPRLQKVLAWQAASDAFWTDQLLLGQNEVSQHVSVLAIAPYISFNIGPETTPNVATVEKWSVDKILDHVEKISLPEALGWIKNQKTVADKYGLKLVCYEAGQHLVGIQGGENSEAMTALLMSANRHPRMGEIYTRYMEAWREEGGDLMCLFSSTSQWGKWGSWGLTEYLDETEADQPKYKAALEAVN